MLRLVELLNEKNMFLEKFCSLNETELKKFVQGDFANLDYFYQTREGILEMIRTIDGQIDRINMETISQKVSDETKREVEKILKIKDQFVNRILNLDLEVLSCIEQAKSAIIRELQDMKKGKKALSGYKANVSSRRLDESY